MKNETDSLQAFLNGTGKQININALSDAAGINRTQMHQYAIGYRRASERTKSRIQQAIDNLAKQLAETTL